MQNFGVFNLSTENENSDSEFFYLGEKNFLQYRIATVTNNSETESSKEDNTMNAEVHRFI